ncbi:MAG: hypothetical protein IPK50_03385 [Fibrobacterota bacterium]|nr:hypothetical protein [Fibrobacterota bacterium]QQS05940.1 MAG: hypothetical protein IPK50_03385 [Fibrobacterota bacterium]
MKSVLQRTLAIAGLSIPAFALQMPFDVPTASMADVKTVYAVDIFKNEMSSANLTVDTGNVLQADIVFSSDTTHFPNPAGTGSYIQGYTANVGILIPLNSAWGVRDLSKFDSLTFEWASNGPIRDQLTASFGSLKYSDTASNTGLVYEAVKRRTNKADTFSSRNLDNAHDWVTFAYRRAEFALPSWVGGTTGAVEKYPARWATEYASLPSFDTVLANVKNIQISPKTTYMSPGWNFSTNVSCGSCAVAYLPVPVLTIRLRNINIWLAGEERPMRLGLSNGLEIGVRDVAKGVRYASLSWVRGTLNLENPSQWSRVQILSVDGKAIASFSASASQPLTLTNGTYYASLTDIQGRVVTQSFQVVR